MGLESREVSSVVWQYTCDRCGYRTHKYNSGQMPKWYGEKHEKDCSRAAEIGLHPIFATDVFMYGHKTKILGWARDVDNASLESHFGMPRSIKRDATREEALAMGYTPKELESCKPWIIEPYKVTELRLVVDDNWQHPIEVYEVPEGWDWRDPSTKIPWLEEEDTHEDHSG